jgi:hypothetical protein
VNRLNAHVEFESYDTEWRMEEMDKYGTEEINKDGIKVVNKGGMEEAHSRMRGFLAGGVGRNHFKRRREP